MKTQVTLFTAAVITAFIVVLILANDIAAAWSQDGKQPAGQVASSENTSKSRSDFPKSLTTTAVVPGIYDLSFRKYRNGVLEPVSSLPLGGGPLVLFAHVEDTNGNPAQDGTVTFEYCGDYEPKENCDAGLARWRRLNRVSIGSCTCPNCGGLPNYDPGPGNACLFVLTTGGTIPGDEGFRFKYAGRRGGVDSGMSGAANFTWTTIP